ncbi:MAG: hypothetical protein ABFR75_12000 [Acidobacteriota bacterium]
MRKYLSLVFLLAIILFFPNDLSAAMQHPSTSGLIVHQAGHIMFLIAMLVLMITIKKTVGLKIEGWKYLYYAALYFAAWNGLGFFVHLLNGLIPAAAFTSQGGYWSTYLSLADQGFVRILFYLTKIVAPILNIVPFYYLYKSLKSFKSIMD